MMSLLDELRKAAQEVDTQFQPASNEIGSLLGALIYYNEHGDKFLQAANDGTDRVTELLAPQPERSQDETDPATPAGVSTAPAGGSLTDDELAKEISDLQAVLDSRRATAQQTVIADHQAGDEGGAV